MISSLLQEAKCYMDFKYPQGFNSVKMRLKKFHWPAVQIGSFLLRFKYCEWHVKINFEYLQTQS